MIMAGIAGAIVAGAGLYIPKHIRPDANGGTKTLDACLRFTVYNNNRRKKENDTLEVVAWGKAAEILGRVIHPGKSLDLRFRDIDSYLKTPTNADGSPVAYVNKKGEVQTYQHYVVSFSIGEFEFGADARKIVESEIQQGFRPQNWNDGGQGADAWKQIVAQRFAAIYDPSMGNRFFYNRVFVPPNATLQADNALKKNTASNAYNGMPGAVAHPQAAGNPVVVGQTMQGYQVQQPVTQAPAAPGAVAPAGMPGTGVMTTPVANTGVIPSQPAPVMTPGAPAGMPGTTGTAVAPGAGQPGAGEVPF